MLRLLRPIDLPAAGNHRRSRRFTLVIAATALMAAIVPALASATSQGGYIVSSSACPTSGQCLATRADITMSSNDTWNVPSTTFGYEWIAAFKSGSPCPSASCIVQIGYAQTISSDPPPCSSTNGAVKIVSYAINSNNAHFCTVDQLVTANEQHTLKVARCNDTNSNWCTYVNGNQVGATYTSPGIGDSAPDMSISGEFGCDTCMGSSTFIGSKWGKGSTSGWNWQTSSNNSTYSNVQSSDVFDVTQTACSTGLGHDPQFVKDPYSNTSKWSIHWENGGLSC